MRANAPSAIVPFHFRSRREHAAALHSGRLQVRRATDVAGCIEAACGSVTLLFSPTEKTARVLDRDLKVRRQRCGRPSIGITLDEPIFVERGQVASHPHCRRASRACLALACSGFGRTARSAICTLKMLTRFRPGPEDRCVVNTDDFRPLRMCPQLVSESLHPKRRF